MTLADLERLCQERWQAGTRVTNCVRHYGLAFDARPRDCDLCATDIQNHLAYALRVNRWLNDRDEIARTWLPRLVQVARAAKRYVDVIGDDTKELDALVDAVAALEARETPGGEP